VDGVLRGAGVGGEVADGRVERDEGESHGVEFRGMGE